MSIFQTIKTEEKYRVLFESEKFFCLLDGFPISPGHCLLIPHREIKSLLELTKDEWIDLRDTIEITIEKLSEVNLIERYKKMYDNAPHEKSEMYIKDAIEYLQNKKVFKPDSFNYGVNDGEAAGMTVNHLHWHIIPRFEGDVTDPAGGIRYIFPEKANYRK
jgi:diadenosine tetraphosphate (Ap4A) HIT family hydrolase